VSVVSFFTEELSFVLKEKRTIRKWLAYCAKKENKEIAELCYIFCGDDYLLDINKKYLNHNTLTDTISFDYADDKGTIVGDVFISIERVQENAKKFSVSFEEEIKRIMIHGFLHLCGYEDKGVKKKEMVAKENIYLKYFYKTFHVEHLTRR
jgi:probable rRNA maturation factor